jgi:hypothetical protein
MISIELARALRDSGLVWHPIAGDWFRIDRIEADEDTFILSDMTVEAHQYDTGTVLGFNGTTEWALDSVELDAALWLPREHQLRGLLGSAFVSLESGFTVTAAIDGVPQLFTSEDAEDAYAKALLAVLDSVSEPEVEGL